MDTLRTRWNTFWFAKADIIRLDAFRVLLGISLILYMSERWRYAREWLTSEGFHVSQPNLAFHPLSFPLLPESFLVGFGVIFFASILAVIFGWQLRWTIWTTWISVCYVTFADHYAAFTANKLFIVTLMVLGLANKGPYFSVDKGRHSVQSVWPIRVLQATFLIHYFSAGWQKAVHGDWLNNPFVLYTQMQGSYRTAFAGWLYQNLAINMWVVMQYAALGFELFGPLLFLFKRTRMLAIVWGLGFQLMLAMSMHQLIYFMLVMTCFYILFVEDKTIHRYFTRATS